VALYRICQEALNNIAKHAKAGKVEIDVHHTSAGMELHICDNGSGFRISDLKPSGHFGLSMMRERAEAVGAVLKIDSRPGKGTEITIRWRDLEVL
jgi:signal transduction histidine kinase